MKKAVHIILIFMMLLPALLQAQRRPGPEMRGQVDEMRKNVYARVLILSKEEEQKFWPVFDKMQAEIDNAHDQMQAERKRIYNNYASLSDAEIEKSLQKMLDAEAKIVEIKRRYIAELKSAIPIKKIALMPRAEHEFKKELIGKLKAGGGPPRMMDDE